MRHIINTETRRVSGQMSAKWWQSLFVHAAPKYMWGSYEVPGMILLCDLRGAMQFDHSIDMSVHVSTCVMYDFNALMPIVWKLWCR
jgi:hypothetical protein